MKLIGVSALIATLCFGGLIEAQPLPVLYDSKIKTTISKISDAQHARIYGDLLRIGGIALRRECEQDKLPATADLAGMARGAFTRRSALQSAYMFRLCYTKRYPDTGFYGLVIYEGAQVIRVFSLQFRGLYEGADELFGVRDINMNGTDELALVWDWGDGCCSSRYLTLLELEQSPPKSLGTLEVGADSETDEGIMQEDWVVYVLKASKPVFIGVERIKKSTPVRMSLIEANIKIRNFTLR